MSYKDKIQAYLKSRRRGKAANRLEREAMYDVFLNDALDGFATTNDDKQLRIDIDNLQQAIHQRTRKNNTKRRSIMRWVTTAAAVLLVFVTGYWLSRPSQPDHKPQLAVVQQPVENTKDTKQPDADIASGVTKNKAETETTQAETKKNVVKVPQLKIDETSSFEMEDRIAEKDSDAKQFKVKESNNIPVAPQPKAVAARVAQNADVIVAEQAELANNKYNDFDSLGFNEPNNVLDEVVIVGYGVAKKKSVEAASVAILKELEPVIGDKAYATYLKEKLMYPDDAREQKLEGKVKLSFLIDSLGKPYDIMVEKSLSASCDNEAIRLLTEGSAWTPSVKKPNKRVSLKVTFEL